ncbi:MAG TPA: hypothetical protein VK718_03930 [Ferruginibacter sp.]|nr:hypothetical protein [Ferruginibacter sp.]
MARIKLLLINYFAHSIGSCGSASLAAVTSEAKADKIMRSRFSSAAKAALEKEYSPAAMSDNKLKKLQPVLMD